MTTGILAADAPGSTIRIVASEFLRNGKCQDRCAHGIYVNELALVHIEGSTLLETHVGHRNAGVGGGRNQSPANWLHEIDVMGRSVSCASALLGGRRQRYAGLRTGGWAAHLGNVG